MKNNTRITAGIMSLMLAFGAGTSVVNTNFNVPLSVMAASAETLTSGAFSYEVLEDDTIKITGFDDSVTEVEIPAEIEGKKVTAIGNKAFYNAEITSVNISAGVTSIGDRVFYKCPNLVSVAIPDGVVSIGHSAFYECRKLDSISIPDSVTKIGDYCFYNCTSLKSARLSESLTELPGDTFYNCSLLSALVIPDNIQTIRGEACYGCKNLKSVSLGKNLQKIDDNAFWDCISLKSITVPEYVTYISFSAFNKCESLNELIIMNQVCSIAGGSNLPKTCIIYGYEDSTAQKYAESIGNPFEVIGASNIIKGDINNNGTVNLADIVILNKFLIGYDVTVSDWKTMDINDDKVVDVFDLCLMRKMLTE